MIVSFREPEAAFISKQVNLFSHTLCVFTHKNNGTVHCPL